MCRFKLRVLLICVILISVSIHPMCRFKLFVFKGELCSCLVSIHPMCRFKNLRKLLCKFLKRFQYILCVGSRRGAIGVLKGKEVSIHPMCRFK